MSSTLVSRPTAGAAVPAAAAPPAAPGTAAAQATLPLADWIERVVRGLDRGGRHWTQARRKEALQRVLAANRRDGELLQQRLGGLLAQWEQDTPDRTPAELDEGAVGIAAPGPAAASSVAPPAAAEAGAGRGGAEGPTAERRSSPPEPGPSSSPPPSAGSGLSSQECADRQALLARVGASLGRALPAQDAAAESLGAELEAGIRALRDSPPDAARAAALAEACDRADRLLAHHRVLVERLGALCDELVGSLAALAEDARWAEGPAEAVRARLADGLNARGLHAVTELLRRTRERQQQLRRQRDEARDALKAFLPRMLAELAALGEASGRFQGEVARHADRIAKADTLESVAGAVQELVGEARDIEAVFGQAQRRLRDEHARASALDERVGRLEGELRRLSDEVATDPLTQLANRRGLFAAFEVERARAARGGEPLAVALLDVDNFKRLNDELGHSAGDAALKHLAGRVAEGLRPTDHVARYGGEEFVLLLPATAVDDALRLLTRLQRGLSEALFLHEQRQVFVTFSAGVTAYRPDEPLELALERADQALYEAKHGGKNRSCAV